MNLRSSNAVVLAAAGVVAVVTLATVSGMGAPGVAHGAAAGPSTPVVRSTAATAALQKTTTKGAVKRTTKKSVKSVAKKSTSKSVVKASTVVQRASVAGVTITVPLAPVSTAPPPTTTATAVPSPTTVPPTSTGVPAPILAPFDVVAVAERVDAAVGTTAAFSIVIAQRGAMNPITLSLVGLPNGMGATLTPNPATGLAVLRIAVPADAVLADYPLRVLGSFNGAQAWANLILRVTPVLASTTTSTTIGSTTTTVDPSGLAASFGFRVTPDGKSLFTGGQVQYEIEPIYDTGYNGSIEYFVSGLPDGVWHGFSEKVTTKKTTLWLSSTVPLRTGRYPFTITGVSKGLKKSGEVVLIIG